jgi:hypothetical protein
VTNTATGKKAVFRSAAMFRAECKGPEDRTPLEVEQLKLLYRFAPTGERKQKIEELIAKIQQVRKGGQP